MLYVWYIYKKNIFYNPRPRPSVTWETKRRDLSHGLVLTSGYSPTANYTSRVVSQNSYSCLLIIIETQGKGVEPPYMIVLVFSVYNN